MAELLNGLLAAAITARAAASLPASAAGAEDGAGSRGARAGAKDAGAKDGGAKDAGAKGGDAKDGDAKDGDAKDEGDSNDDDSESDSESEEVEVLDGFDFDGEQTEWERSEMLAMMSEEDRGALRVAIVEGVIAPIFPQIAAKNVGAPLEFFMATEDTLDDEDVEGRDRKARRFCAIWTLRVYRGEKATLYDLCGWVDDGDLGDDEVGAGVVLGDGDPRLVYHNRDGALVFAESTPGDTKLLRVFEERR